MSGNGIHLGDERAPRAWPSPGRLLFWLAFAAATIGVVGGIARAVAPAVIVTRHEYDEDKRAQAAVNQSGEVFRATMGERLDHLNDLTGRLEQVTVDLTTIRTQLDERTGRRSRP